MDLCRRLAQRRDDAVERHDEDLVVVVLEPPAPDNVENGDHLDHLINSRITAEAPKAKRRQKPTALVIGPTSARVVDARSGLAWTAFAQAMAHATSSLPAGERGEIVLAFETLANAAHGVAEAISRLPTD